MAAAKKEGSQDPARPLVKPSSKVPLYLPTADPPKPRLWFLVVMSAVTVIWVGLLVYLALQQVSDG